MPFVCKKRSLLQNPPENPNDPGCDPDWRRLNEKCFKTFEGQWLTFPEASVACQQQQAKLVSIHNQAENGHVNFLRNCFGVKILSSIEIFY